MSAGELVETVLVSLVVSFVVSLVFSLGIAQWIKSGELPELWEDASGPESGEGK